MTVILGSVNFGWHVCTVHYISIDFQDKINDLAGKVLVWNRIYYSRIQSRRCSFVLNDLSSYLKTNNLALLNSEIMLVSIKVTLLCLVERRQEPLKQGERGSLLPK